MTFVRLMNEHALHRPHLLVLAVKARALRVQGQEIIR